MGLLSNRVGKEKLKAGDHIYSWRAAYVYAHHGIYIGDDKVIHFTRGGHELGGGRALGVVLLGSLPPKRTVHCDTCTLQEGGHGVILSCLSCFLSGGDLYRCKYAVNPALFLAKARGGTCTLATSDPNDIVVHRAKLLHEKGFGCYNLFKKNCEDFSIYCKTGLLVVERSPTGTSGQAVSIVGGPLSALVSTSLGLVTKNPFFMAATAIGAYCASRYAADISKRGDVEKMSVEDLTRGIATGSMQLIEPPIPTASVAHAR